MDWQILDRADAHKAIDTVQSTRNHGLFNPLTSEAKYAKLPFYESYSLYRMTNFATLPCFTLDYLSDGERFFQLDGAANTIYKINEKADITLNTETVVDYLRFFLLNVRIDEGEVFLVEKIDDLPFTESLNISEMDHIYDHFKAPIAEYETSLNAFIVNCTLYFMGILMHTSVKIDQDGIVSILNQSMLMQAGSHAATYR